MQLVRTHLPFESLVLAVAEDLSIAFHGEDGTEVAQVPSDPHDLDLCRRIANDGLQKFWQATRDWQFLEPEVELTFDPTGASAACVDGDAGRMRLPAEFSGIARGFWTYISDGAPRWQLTDCGASYMASLRAVNDHTTGLPTHAAFVQAQPTDRRNRRATWELWLYPKPSTIYTIKRQLRLTPDRISDLDVYPVGGPAFWPTMLAAVRAQAELHRLKQPGPMAMEYGATLASALELNGAAKPKSTGFIAHVDSGPERTPARTWNLSVNGVPMY